MTDLRQAAQMALDALDSDNPDIQLRAAVTLRAALAAPQPEPVAFYDFGNHRMRWAKPTTYDQLVSVDVPELPLYTHPPQRQPLSDTDILQGWKSATKLLMGVPTDQVVLSFGRWLEAMHGIGGDK